MNAIPIPQPKTYGGRPPFEPPRKTTFDSTPGDSPEPMHKLMVDSVRNLMKHVSNCQPEQYSLMLRLIGERKELVLNELQFERMMAPDTLTLPPLLKNMYSLDFLFEETEVVRIYGMLLETLHEAEQSILAKIGDQNTEAPASEL